MSTVRNALFVLAWVMVYLAAVVPFDAARLVHFALLVGAVLAIILVAAVWLVAWLMGPVSRYLDATDEERTDPELLHDAFRNVMDLPRLIFKVRCFGPEASAVISPVLSAKSHCPTRLPAQRSPPEQSLSTLSPQTSVAPS